MPLPASVEGFSGSARLGRAQHPHDIRRDCGAPEDEFAADRASRSPGDERVGGTPLLEQSEDILGVTVRKVVIPVAAGRNLAVVVQAGGGTFNPRPPGLPPSRGVV